MDRQIAFKSKKVNAAGVFLDTGDTASDFRVTSQEMEEITLDRFKGKTKVITTFPSLDTPVCDLQVKEFNQRASGFSPDVAVLGMSMDLPFAQKRFCQMNNIKDVFVLSDYKNKSFALNYGLLVKELQLLARSVMIVDAGNVIRYFQIVPEIASPPDYESAISALEKILAGPAPANDIPPVYDLSGNNWMKKDGVISKKISFSEKKDLILYSEILSALAGMEKIEFAIDSREKEAIISLTGNYSPILPLLISKIKT